MCRRLVGREDQVDLAADELGGERGQPLKPALCGAVFDRHVLSLEITGFTQPLKEPSPSRRSGAGGSAGAREEADHRHRLLLGVSEERPAKDATEQCDEIPSLHVVLYAKP